MDNYELVALYFKNGWMALRTDKQCSISQEKAFFPFFETFPECLLQVSRPEVFLGKYFLPENTTYIWIDVEWREDQF